MTTLLFLPSGTTGFRWMRLADQRVVDEGEGVPRGDARTDGATIAVAPADAVTLHWAELPSRSTAQATAAARILATEASAAPLAELHVAVGDEGRSDRPIGVVGIAVMQGWRLTAIVTGDSPPATIDRATLEAALVAAVAAVPLDLRQGVFARRRRQFALDWPLIRRLAVLAGLILAVTLAISLVRIGKYSFGADMLETQADLAARSGLPRGETVTDAARQLDERLSRVRGPGLGFSTTSAAIFAAVRAMPGTEITALDFQPNGTVRLGVAVEREALATDLKRALEIAGFTVQAGVFQSAAGRVTGELTISAGAAS